MALKQSNETDQKNAKCKIFHYHSVLLGWEGNHKSGVALAMHHGLSGLSTYGLNGQRLGDEPMLLMGRAAVIGQFATRVPGRVA